MKTITQRVSLNDENSLGFGVLITCCNIRQPINRKELEPYESWSCLECEKPLVFCDSRGDYYFVGGKVFHEG